MGAPLLLIVGVSCFFGFGVTLAVFIVVSYYLEPRRARAEGYTTELPNPEGNPESTGVVLAMFFLQSRSSTGIGSENGEPSSPILESSPSS
jgi:hypothetical protein